MLFRIRSISIRHSIFWIRLVLDQLRYDMGSVWFDHWYLPIHSDVAKWYVCSYWHQRWRRLFLAALQYRSDDERNGESHNA